MCGWVSVCVRVFVRGCACVALPSGYYLNTLVFLNVPNIGLEVAGLTVPALCPALTPASFSWGFYEPPVTEDCSASRAVPRWYSANVTLAAAPGAFRLGLPLPAEFELGRRYCILVQAVGFNNTLQYAGNTLNTVVVGATKAVYIPVRGARPANLAPPSGPGPFPPQHAHTHAHCHTGARMR